MDRLELIDRLRTTPPQARVITALDVPDAEQARTLAGRLGPSAGLVKVGLELFSAAGPSVVRELRQLGCGVFLDLKFHDIPNTVAAAASVAARLGAAMCTVHAGNGRSALRAAADALATGPVDPDTGVRPALLAVTILTSLGEDDLQEIAPSPDSLNERVVRLAQLAWDSGCDGLVCSAADLPVLRQAIGPHPLIVTPGIRPAGVAQHDQQRIATPRQALAAGADYLVVGRPITRAEDPAAALAAITAEMT